MATSYFGPRQRQANFKEVQTYSPYVDKLRYKRLASPKALKAFNIIE